MNIDKFEEKAKEIIKENNLFISYDAFIEDSNASMFRVNITSLHKDKTLNFNLVGHNCFFFDVRATNFDELFDKALKVLKAYSPKTTRERKPKDAQDAPEITTQE